MIDPARLEALEGEVVAALDGTGPEGLDVIGYGEISTVVRVEGTTGPVAAKRLPMMSPSVFASYRGTVEDYLAALAGRGVTVAPTELYAVGGESLVPYCVQPLYPAMLADVLAAGGESDGLIRRLVGTVAGAVGDGIGLDGQVSNWAVAEGDLVYLDVTTPLLRDPSGEELLDTDLFLASLPWALRGMVRRFLLGEILAHYYDTRAVLLDLVANLHKEGLTSWIETFIVATGAAADPPLTFDEVHRYYRRDAAMWEVLQRLRRADRWWQRCRRRRYPFLLPGSIER